MFRKPTNEVPRLPMGLAFGAASDPGRIAAMRRQRMIRLGSFGLGAFLVVAASVAITRILAESQSYAKSMSAAEAAKEAEARDTKILIVASEAVAKGQKLNPSAMREIRWPRDQVPEGSIGSVDEVGEKFASVDIPANLPVLQSMITSVAPLSGIQDLLAPGHRAITISVNATTGIEGWATAGAHVDLMLTYLDPEQNVNTTRVVVENATVLSFGGNAKREFDRGGSGRGSAEMRDVSTVTLGVPFSDALKITTAMDMGRISLALRNSEDVGSQGQGVFSADEWEKKKALPTVQKQGSKGYAKIMGPDGREKQFMLNENERWQHKQADEFF